MESKVTVPPEVEKLATAWASDGKTVLYALAQVGYSELSQLKTRFGLNPVKPLLSYIGMVSASR